MRSFRHNSPRPILALSLAVSALFQAVALATMAQWSVHFASPSPLIVRSDDATLQLLLHFTPPEPPPVEFVPPRPQVVISPDSAEIEQQQFADVTTAEVMEVALAEQLVRDTRRPSPSPSPEAKPPVAAPPPAPAAPPRERPPAADTQTPPSFRGNRPPIYPDTARLNRWQGTVYLRIRVAVDGRITQVDVARSSGYPVLDAAAVRAVRILHGQPARRNGHPTATIKILPVRFELP